MIDSLAPIALWISSFLFASIWEGALVVAAVWLALRFLPQLGASTRYAIWLCTLAMLVVAPICTVALSAQHDATSPPSATLPPAARAELHTSGLVTVEYTTNAKQAASLPQLAPLAQPMQRQRIPIPAGLAIAVGALWLLVAVGRSSVLVRHLGALADLRRRSPHIRDAHGYPVLASQATPVPLAFGFFHPAVVLPATMLGDISEETVDAIIMHEVAHLRRYDVWTNACARVLEALLALNPTAWFVQSRLSIEREIACDDWVVARLDAGELFATALAKMACRPSFAPLAAPSAIGSKNNVVARIERLMDRRPRRLRLSPVALTSVVLLFAIIASLVPSVSPVLASPTSTSDCNHPILIRRVWYTKDQKVVQWLPMFGATPADSISGKVGPAEAFWGKERLAYLDVTVDASGKATNVVVVSSPDAAGAAHAKTWFSNHVTYRPAMANCKAIASTQRVFYPVISNSQRVYSIVEAVYPDGWSNAHPNACRVPALIHDTPELFAGNHATRKLIANYRVFVDASGRVVRGERVNESGNTAFDDAVMNAARSAIYPLSDTTGFKPVRPDGATLAWNASHGYSVYSKCSPPPQIYIWTADVDPAGQPFFSK